ncbi:MAG: hypothetical protein PHO30_06270, partial [Candidatus Omnitrophica bacterium]|nr:hypothetical protein [Candidatus Omnitrophota bacterium]
RAFYEAGLTLLAPIDTLMLRRGLSFLRQAASSSDEDFYGMDELSPESALKANDLRTLELIGEAI